MIDVIANYTIPVNSSIYVYAPDPSLLSNEIPGQKVGAAKSVRLACDPYFFELYSNTTTVAGSATTVNYRKYTFRNGSVAWYAYNTTATAWTLSSWMFKPNFYYQYVWEVDTYTQNVTNPDGSWTVNN